jgi:hypothetical protein
MIFFKYIRKTGVLQGNAPHATDFVELSHAALLPGFLI